MVLPIAVLPLAPAPTLAFAVVKALANCLFMLAVVALLMQRTGLEAKRTPLRERLAIEHVTLQPELPPATPLAFIPRRSGDGLDRG